MENLLGYVINGALIGLLYALVAVGFVTVYRSTRVFNLAQGEIVVVSGFLVWWFVSDLGLPMALGVLAAFATAVVLGLSIERALFRPLVGQPEFSLIMVTIGLMVLLRGAVLFIWGPENEGFPAVFDLSAVTIGPYFLDRALVWGAFLSVAAALALTWFFSRTRLGLEMTAVAEDHQVALSLGVSVPRSIAMAWAMNGVLATVAAIVLLNGKQLGLSASEVGFAALPVALLAGVESVGGIILAGLIVGVSQGLAVGYLDSEIAGISSIFPYLLMIVVILIRPTGLFGWRSIERV